MEKIEINKTIAIVTIKLMVMQVVFALVYLATSLISDSFDQFNNGAFLNEIKYDSFAFIIIALVQLGFTFYILLDWIMDKYIIEPDKIKHQSGIIFRKTDSHSIKNVEKAVIKEGVLGRLLNYGTINIQGITANSVVVLKNIADPFNLMLLIEDKLFPNKSPTVQYLDSGEKKT